MKNKKFVFVLAASLLLTGCGGTTQSASSTTSSKEATSSSQTASSSSTASSSAVSSSASSSSISSDSSSSNVVAKYKVASVQTLSPSFFTLSIKEGDEFESKSQVTITLTAGDILSSGFDATSNHLEHIYVYVNDVCYKPSFPEGVTFSKTIDISVTMPESDATIVACYSIQQHVKTDGHSVSFEENANVKAVGVLATEKYDYLDFHAICADTYLITKAEYRLASDTTKTWVDIPFNGSSTTITKEANGHYVVAVRPNSEDLTDDVVVRFTGESHTRHTITYSGLDDDKYMNDESTLPVSALDGEDVSVSVFAKSGVYVKSLAPAGIPAANIIDNSTLSKLEFTMPNADVSFAITFGDAMSITTVANDNIASVLYYTDNPGYGESVTTAVPGNSLYVAASAKSGYLFTGASINGGEKVAVTNNYSVSYALLSIPEDAEAIAVTLYTAATHTSTVVASTNGEIKMDRTNGQYATGETVSLTVSPASGYILDAITITKSDDSASGVSATVDTATGNASFTMPDFDVKVAATFKVDPEAGSKATVSLSYDSDEYTVSISSSNVTYDANPFTVTKNTSVYLSVTDNYGTNFHVKVEVEGSAVIDTDATQDEESGEYKFGKSFQVTGDTTITIAAA
jgi:hypothetical protein